MEYRTIEEWPWEQAKAEDDAFVGHIGDPTRPIFRFLAFRFLEDCEAQYKETKRGLTILGAIRRCANCDIVMPLWLAKAFISRFDLVITCKVNSWDKAFDRPFPKGAHINALRKKRSLEFAVWNSARELLLREPDTPIDKALFEVVGKPLGLGTTLAEEYYYSVSHRFGADLKVHGASPVGRKNRQKSRK